MTTTTQTVTPILIYEDIAAAHEFLVTMFGFEPGRIDRDDNGAVVHGEATIGGKTVWLHRVDPEHGLGAAGRLGAASGMLNVFLDDVDAHHERVAAAGALIIYPPTDMPYGQREFGAYDSEGRPWSFATRL